MLLLELLDAVLLVATDVADGDAGLLDLVLDDLDQLLATLLGQRREWDPDDLAVVAGIESELGFLEFLLDRGYRAAIVGLDHQQPWLRGMHLGQLLQRGRGTVVVDVDPLQQRWCGPTRAGRR